MATKKKVLVLVVEDNRPLSKAMKIELEKADFEVDQAYDGKEALEKVSTSVFDLFIVDLIMPEMDGFTFIAEVKKREIKTPIMVVSNISGEESEDKKIKAIVDTYLIKTDISLADVVNNAKRLTQK